jgi:hypothetical protein
MRLLVSAFLICGSQAQALPINTSPTAVEFGSSDYNFHGIVDLGDCSGALVRYEHSKPSDKGMVLTNGHCISVNGGFIEPETYLQDEPITKTFRLLSASGKASLGKLRGVRVLYAAMTGTDIALIELNQTYQDIIDEFKVKPLLLDSVHPTVQEKIDILSGYARKGYSCQIEKFVFELREDAYTFTDSIRYSEECKPVHGTSGSPILAAGTDRVIGINNTGNDSGEKCTMDNPCEVDEQGEIFYRKGISYGQQTYQIYSCLDESNKIDLSIEGCQLFH